MEEKLLNILEEIWSVIRREKLGWSLIFQDVGDYEYDAQIADSFALPASDNELEELYHAR